MHLRPGGRQAVFGEVVPRRRRILPLHAQRRRSHQAVQDKRLPRGGERIERHPGGAGGRLQGHQRPFQLRGHRRPAQLLHGHEDGGFGGNYSLVPRVVRLVVLIYVSMNTTKIIAI